MEVNTTNTAGPPTVATKNHTFTQHHLNSENHKHSHDHFPFKAILITISVNETSKDDSRILHDTSSRLIASTMLNSNSSPDVKGGCLYGGNLSRTPTPKFRGVQVFTYRELEVATDGFSEANAIGNGGVGLIYKGVLSDGTLAAIKLLRSEGKQGERAFRIEVDLLSRLHSPYLVELLGYCADQTTVSPVIHRDFKSNNVLLDQNFRAKVSDFGLAKMGSEKRNGQVSTRVLGTTGYLAPEYASTGKLTTKSDVYSYGVVLLELLTGRVPVDIKRAPGEHVLVSWALPRLTNREKVVEMVDPALRGQYSKKDLIQIAAIAAMCIQPEADYRPLMTDVVQSLTLGEKQHVIPYLMGYHQIANLDQRKSVTPTAFNSGDEGRGKCKTQRHFKSA
ncbi:Serine-threonine/tyrosine-protein kinase, catalytic domain [Sesbania bispinosa]|nr:Serine-threonine/tyrosine-protein kinase, catalytic domain [Sesbania bispinosa]